MTKRMDAIHALPFAHRRLRRAQLVWLLALLAGCGLGSVLWRPSGGPLAVILAASYGGMVLGFVMFFHGMIDWAFRRRLRRTATAAGYRLCPRCGYDASRGVVAGATAQCPECGESFDVKAVATLWRIYLA